MDWSPGQVKALDAVGRWLAARDRPVFRLFGPAGTGKTSLALHLARQAGGPVLFAAYTGKAASVMRRAGCHGATTIHSLAYLPRPKSTQRLESLLERLETLAPGPERDELERQVDDEKDLVRRPGFELNPDSPIADASLLVLDECSMVPEPMAKDLLSFGTPVLVLGDPAQLPPVMGAGFFTAQEPDVYLTEIHRQALDNPIIRLATDVREGRGLGAPRDLGSGVRVVRKGDVDPDAVPPETQVLVGRNATRRRANHRIRASRGYGTDHPLPEERLVCLRNNHQLGLMNGSTWDVVQSCPLGPEVNLLVADDDGYRVSCRAHMAPFLGQDVPWGFARLQAEEFDFGYALTVHKSQGSQWSDVWVVDESRAFGRDAARWLYTAATRAAERLTIIVS